jgi:hypothetical protein
MGRGNEPLGDLGEGRETWTPPAGAQGISNRPDDNGTMTDLNPSPLDEDEQIADADDLVDDEDEEFEDDDDEGDGPDDDDDENEDEDEGEDK